MDSAMIADVKFVQSFTMVWSRTRYLIVTRLWPKIDVEQPDPESMQIRLAVGRDDVEISTS